jgi:tetratricopeptide (TPR) repeat protein
LQIAQHFGQRENLCYVYNNLGGIAFCHGEFTRASAYYQQGQEQARQIGHRALLSYLMVEQGECLILQHEYTQARQVLLEAIAIARQIQHAEYLSHGLATLGKTIAYMESYNDAMEYFQESLTLTQQLSAPLRLITLLTEWGEIELFHGLFDAARGHFQDVLTFDVEEQHYPDRLALAHYGMAQIAYQEQDIGKAHQHAAESLRLFEKIGYYKAQEVQTWMEALPEVRTMLSEQESTANGGS